MKLFTNIKYIFSNKERNRIEAIAYNNWIQSLNKKGFPRTESGNMMDCWQLYDYFSKSPERGAYIKHAKT